MCILFFQTKVNPSDDEYAVIAINNRDEDYRRPTLKSHFWNEASHVIGGRDATVGKEGGTWLAMSSSGKIGVLLNILQPAGEENPNAKGRGSLVSDYLTGSISSRDYLTAIYQEKHLYNNFNLVTIDAKPPFDNYVIGHYSNLNDDPPEFLTPGLYGIGNCHSDTPWRKINYGREKFAKICQQFPSTDNKEQLIEQLIALLTDKTTHFPDPQLEKQGKGKSETTLQSLSALCLHIPQITYGTRTNSVILVDGGGNVDYIERTMEDQTDFNNPQFVTTRHKFTIK